MAYHADVVGWQDWDDERYMGQPEADDLPAIQGLFIHAYDEETGDDQYYWLRLEAPPDPGQKWDWDNWADYIAGSMEDYGLELA